MRYSIIFCNSCQFCSYVVHVSYVVLPIFVNVFELRDIEILAVCDKERFRKSKEPVFYNCHIVMVVVLVL